MTKDSNPDHLLGAAASRFRAHGYASTTLREIARHAGILPGSLYYRFPSKESLLLALMERAVARAIDAVRVAIVDIPDPVERVRIALRTHLRLLLSGDDAVYVLLYDWRALGGTARAKMVRLRDRYDALWDGLLHQAAGAARVRPGVDLRLLRMFGFGAVNWAAQWYSSRGPQTPDQIADAFWSYMAEGVLEAPPAAKRKAQRR